MTKLKKNMLEWVVFAVSLVLVGGTVAYLGYAGWTMGQQPPSIEVRLGTAEQHVQSYVLPVTVFNHGDETAASLRVEVVLVSGSGKEERGELDIPFVPRHAKREGWVTFEQDPRSGQLKARVLGYETP